MKQLNKGNLIKTLFLAILLVSILGLTAADEFYWNAETYQEGENPEEWVEVLTGDVSAVETDQEGKYIIIDGENEERDGAEFVPPPEAEEVEWYAKARPTAQTNDINTIARWQNSQDPESDGFEAVRADWDHGSDQERLSEYIEGDFNELTTQTQSVPEDEVSFVRGQAEEQNLRGRWWQGEEPEEWDLETSTQITDPGTLGLLQWEGTIQIYEFGVGVEGSEAPSNPVENEIILNTPEEGHQIIEGEQIEFEYVISASEPGEAALIIEDEQKQVAQLDEGVSTIDYQEVFDEPGDYEWRVEFDPDEGDLIESETREVVVEEELDVDFDLIYPEEDQEFGGSQEIEFSYQINTNKLGDARLFLDGQEIDETRLSTGQTTINVTEDVDIGEKEWYLEFQSREEIETSQTSQFNVLESFFEVDIVDTNDPVEPGDTLTVDAEITNIGDAEDTQEVDLIFNSELEDSETLTISPGSENSLQETFTTDNTDISQDVYNAIVESENDEDQQEVQISETFGDIENLCGEEHELTPDSNDGSRYNEIVIEGTVEICDEGATIEANNLVEISDQGEVIGGAEDGADDEDGEDAPDVEIISNQVDILGPINMDGGNGGDGGSGRDAGGDGGDAGDITITSFEEPINIQDTVSAEGGDGGDAGGGAATTSGDGGDGGIITLNYREIIEEADLLVSGGNAGAGGDSPGSDGVDGEIIRNTPEFTVAEIQSEEVISQGDSHEITALIENTGEFIGSSTPEFYFPFDDEEPVDTGIIEDLQTGESAEIDLLYQNVDEEPGDYFQEVSTRDDSLQQEITVATEDIIIRDIDTNTPVTQEEDDNILDVEVIVENIGPVSGAQDIEFYFDNDFEKSQETEELGSDDLEVLNFDLDISGETDGEYPVAILSEDDMENITIVKGESPYFEVDITEINDPVEEGEILEIDAEIENVGGETDEQQIIFEFDGEKQESLITELASGETTEETFNYDTDSEEVDGSGEYTVTVSSEDEEDNKNAFIGEEPFFDLEIFNLEEEYDPGDIINFDVEVENTGDFEDTQDIDFFFDGSFEDQETETLDGQETSIIDRFSKDTEGLPDGLYEILTTSDDSTDVREVQIGEYEPAPGDTSYEYLGFANVNGITSIENTNTNEEDGYIDFTSLDEAELKRGESYEVELQSEPNSDANDERPPSGPGGGGDDGETEWYHYFSMWADWEQDLQFDTEVQVDSCDDATSEEGCTAISQFTVPEDAELGETRVRTFVLGDEEDDADYISSPTTDIYEGQSHDYQVNIVDSNFQITNIESEEIVGNQQTLLINATIENTGEADDTQDIEYFFDEEKEDPDDIITDFTIEGGQAKEAQFEYVVEEEEGEYTQRINTGDDTETETIRVEQANYEPDIIETNSPIQDDSEPVEVTVEIENTGVVTEPQDIEFRFDDKDAEEAPDEIEEDFEVSPGETEQLTFTEENPPEEDGEYPVRVDTENDFTTSTVIIGTDPFFETQITDTNSPVNFEEEITFITEVENVGGTEDTQDIQLELGNVLKTRENINLDTDESETLSFDIDTGELDDGPGLYDANTSSEDDNDIEQVEIEGYEIPTGGVTDFEYLSLVEIEEEDGTLGIENPSGDDDGYADYTEDETGQKATLEAGETYNIKMASDLNDDSVEGEDHHFNIFVDWNQNIEFDQEPINLELCEAESDGCTIDTEFTVPEDAELGETRLRAFLRYDQYQEDPAREEDFFGEAEDYTVEISDSEFEIIDSELPETAEPGDTIILNATIENTGTGADTQNIEFMFDDEIEGVEEELTLGSEDTENIRFEYTLSEDKEEGEIYAQEIKTQDDNVQQDLEIIIIEGTLEIELTEPQTDITLSEGDSFNAEAEIECIEGQCSETESFTQYGEESPDTIIPSEQTVDDPFFTDDENRQVCSTDLTEGETCIVEWTITMDSDGDYLVNARAESENSAPVESNSIEVSSEATLILETGFEEVDFGSEPPSTEDEPELVEGQRNREEVYTVSLDENSPEPDGLWMKSTPLENIEEDSTNEDGDNAIIEPEHTLFEFNDDSESCEIVDDVDRTQLERSSESFQQIRPGFSPGDQEEKCYYQEIPNAKLAGTYEGSLTLKVNETQ